MTALRTPTRTTLVATDGPYFADPTGATDSSTAFTSFVNAVAASGTTRNGYVPFGTYQVLDCYVPSGVTLFIEAGTTFRFPSVVGSADCACFRLHTSNRSSTSYIQNVRLIGLGTWTIDLSAYTPPGGTNPRGIQVLNAKDFEITNLVGNGIGGTAGNTIACGANQALTRPTHGRFTNIGSTGVRGIGSSCVQLTGGYDIEVDGVYADGGVPARMELDNNAGDIAEQVHWRRIWLTNESGFANTCGYFEAHLNTIRNCSIREFRTDTPAVGIDCAYQVGGSVSNITASDGLITGGGKGVKAFIGQTSTGVPLYANTVFERITVTGCIDPSQAFDVVDGITYRDCHATGGISPGFGPTGTQGGSGIATPAVGSVAVLDNCTSMLNSPVGVYAAGIERIVINGGTYNDTAARIAVSPGSNLVTNTGFETNTTGWSAGTDSVITRITTDHNTGTASLQFYKNTAGDALCRTATGTSGFAVTAGHSYLVTCYAKNLTGTPRLARTNIWWYKSDGTFISATLGSLNVQTNASTWVLLQGVTIAPALAAFATIIPDIVATAGSADKHAIDDVSVADYTGAATQLYGMRVDSGTTATLIGVNMATNKTARFTGAGTVNEATLGTVTS